MVAHLRVIACAANSAPGDQRSILSSSSSRVEPATGETRHVIITKEGDAPRAHANISSRTDGVTEPRRRREKRVTAVVGDRPPTVVAMVDSDDSRHNRQLTSLRRLQQLFPKLCSWAICQHFAALLSRSSSCNRVWQCRQSAALSVHRRAPLVRESQDARDVILHDLLDRAAMSLYKHS